jgi:hypothetical protein
MRCLPTNNYKQQPPIQSVGIAQGAAQTTRKTAAMQIVVSGLLVVLVSGCQPFNRTQRSPSKRPSLLGWLIDNDSQDAAYDEDGVYDSQEEYENDQFESAPSKRRLRSQVADALKRRGRENNSDDDFSDNSLSSRPPIQRGRPSNRMARLSGARGRLSDESSDNAILPTSLSEQDRGNDWESENKSRPDLVETETPEANLDSSLSDVPAELRDLLARQMKATERFHQERDTRVNNLDRTEDVELTAYSGGMPSANQSQAVRMSLSDVAPDPLTDPQPTSQPEFTRIDNTDASSDLQASPTRKRQGLSPGKHAFDIAPLEYASNSQSTRDDDSVVLATHEPKSTSNDRSMTEQSDDQFDPDHPTDSSPQNWSESVATAISALEKEISDSPPADENLRLHQEATLRMLQLASGKLDAALDPIEGLAADEREYFRHQLQAFYEATNPESTPVRTRRWSLVMNSQQQATKHLSAVSNLQIAKARFCTDVQGYGVINEFERMQFQPDQDLLLYCELENVASEAVKDGFETQLQGSYEILDPSGNRIADQLLPMEREICQNSRRDYFIVYRIYMPPQIMAGNYQMRLTIEDMKAKKFGQRTIDFQIAK